MRIVVPAVLFPGGDAAADVSLGLVHLQDFLHLLVQHPIELGQPFGDVLVHCGFADAEFLCGGADRGPVFDDVLSEPLGPLLHITLQNTTLPASCWSILCGEKRGYARAGTGRGWDSL